MVYLYYSCICLCNKTYKRTDKLKSLNSHVYSKSTQYNFVISNSFNSFYTL